MNYRLLGKDLTVSAIGLRCMGMSHTYGAPSDRREMAGLLGYCASGNYWTQMFIG